VLVQQAAVQTAEANIEKAQLNVDYTSIDAPIEGRIDIAAFDVGNLVGPDSGVLATINLMDPIYVTFSIAETWYLELVQEDLEDKRSRGGEDFEMKQAGDSEEEFTHVPLLKLPTGTMYEYPGTFNFFDNKVDEATGTVLIRAEFPNPDRLLLPGQFANVVIEKEQPIDAVLIPQAALLTDQGGSYVLLVNDEDTVEARRVQAGQRFGPNIQIREGLQSGDRIVLYGIQKVRPGLTVKPELTEMTRDPLANVTSSSALAEPDAIGPAPDLSGMEDPAGADGATDDSGSASEPQQD
jgi:membrane fusion protein (multidrug efflux system)